MTMKFDNFGVYINRSQHKNNGTQYKIQRTQVHINAQFLINANKRCYKSKEMVNSIKPSSSMI